MKHPTAKSHYGSTKFKETVDRNNEEDVSNKTIEINKKTASQSKTFISNDYENNNYRTKI